VFAFVRPDTCAFAPRVVCARPCFVLCRRGRARLCRGVSAFPPFAIPICKVSLGLGVIGR
jgi:hypothetical protein